MLSFPLNSPGYIVYGPLLNTTTAAYGLRASFRILSGLTLVGGLAAGLPLLRCPSGRARPRRPSGEKALCPRDCSSSSSDAAAVATDSSVLDPEILKGVDESAKLPAIAKASGRVLQTDPLSPFRVLRNLEAWFFVFSCTLSQFGWSFVIVNYVSGCPRLRTP